MRTIMIIFILSYAAYTYGDPDVVRPPKSLQEEEIWADESVTLKCLGDLELRWTFKQFGLTTIQATKDNPPRNMSTSTTNSPGQDGYKHMSTLELSSDKRHIQGFYYCHYGSDTSDNTLRNTKKSVEMYVYLSSMESYIANPETSTKKQMKVDEGESLILDCRATNPNATVLVFHKTKEIWNDPLQEPRLGFTLKNISKKDTGEYKCYVLGDEDFTEYFDISLKEDTNKPYVSIKPNYYPVVGQDLKLYCNLIQQSLKPNFNWNLPNPSANHFIIDREESMKGDTYHMSYLEVRDLTVQDSGNYECTVSVENQRPSKQTLNIIVEETKSSFVKIVVPKTSSNITVKEGGDVTLTFNITTFPPNPEIVVDNDNKKFVVDYQRNGTTLTLEKATPSDFGNHVVTVTTLPNGNFSVEKGSATIHLIVESSNELTIRAESEVVTPNSNATVVCNVTGYPLNDVTWGYKLCPKGVCGDIINVSEDDVTTRDPRGNQRISTYLFVAEDSRRVFCDIGKERKETAVIVTEEGRHHQFSLEFVRMNDSKSIPADNNTFQLVESDKFIAICTARSFDYKSPKFLLNEVDENAKVTDESTDFTYIKKLDISNITKDQQGHYMCEAPPKDGARVRRKMQEYMDIEVIDLVPVYLLPGPENNMKEEHNHVNGEAKLAFMFKCLVNGTPPINISWTKDGQSLDREHWDIVNNDQEIKVEDLNPETHTGNYSCQASNRAGTVIGYLSLEVGGGDPVTSKSMKIILGIVLSAIALLILVVAFLAWRVRRDLLKRKEANRTKALLFKDGRPGELNKGCNANDQAELLPYDEKWEVNLDRIRLGAQLGAGAFGRVVKAIVSNLEEGKSSSTVAIKMCKSQGDQLQIRALTLELKILIHLGRHLNIVNLLGAHTSRVSKGELWILVEYCRYGSLLSFLHRHRRNYVNAVDPTTGVINLDIEAGTYMSPLSPARKSSNASLKYSDGHPKSPLPKSPTISEAGMFESSNTGSSSIVFANRKQSQEFSSEDLRSQRRGMSLCSSTSHNIQKEEEEEEERKGVRASCPTQSFRLDNPPKLLKQLSNGMTCVENPSYRMVPTDEEKALPPVFEDSHGRKSSITSSFRKQSLMAQDSLGNNFMYDKSSIPGVNSSFTTVDLLCWAWQVAEGMDYLSRRKILHGDLALRNLLLAEDNVVKISDFGLSRDIYSSDIYQKQSSELMPVKWMSIEAIRDLIFSVQSDVWSFGVTVWELFTLGSTPYPGVVLDPNFLPRLEEGYRMEKPNYANDAIYQLMLHCWKENPEDRPPFRNLADSLNLMLMPETIQHYNDKNNEYVNYNEERFKTETDYLEMLLSPDFKNLNRDDDCILDDEDPYLNMDSTASPGWNSQDQGLKLENAAEITENDGYLPMSPTSEQSVPSFGIFSPRKTAKDHVFLFDDNMTGKESPHLLQEDPPQEKEKQFPTDDQQLQKEDRKVADDKHLSDTNDADANYVNIPSLSSEVKAPSNNSSDPLHPHSDIEDPIATIQKADTVIYQNQQAVR